MEVLLEEIWGGVDADAVDDEPYSGSSAQLVLAVGVWGTAEAPNYPPWNKNETVTWDVEANCNPVERPCYAAPLLYTFWKTSPKRPPHKLFIYIYFVVRPRILLFNVPYCLFRPRRLRITGHMEGMVSPSFY